MYKSRIIKNILYRFQCVFNCCVSIIYMFILFIVISGIYDKVVTTYTKERRLYLYEILVSRNHDYDLYDTCVLVEY